MLYKKIICILSFIVLPCSAESLLDLYKLAKQNDPILQQSVIELMKANEIKNETKGALLPQISASVQYSSNRYIDHGKNFGSHKNSFTQNKVWNAGIQLTQPLFNKKNWAKISLQDKIILQTQVSHSNIEQNLRYRTAFAYITALKKIERLTSIRAEKKALKINLNHIKQRVSVGELSITDKYAAQAQYDAVVAKEILAQNDVDNSYENLFEITKNYPSHLLKLNKKKLKFNKIKSLAYYYNLAKQNNKTLIYNNMAIDLAKDKIDLLEMEHFPVVNLTGSINRTNSQSPVGYLNDRTLDKASIGIEVNIPLYSGGQIYSRTKQQRFDHQMAVSELEKSKRDIKKNLNMIINSLNAIKSSIKAYQQAAISANSAYKSVSIEYQVGSKTTVDVLNSLRVKYQSLEDLSNTRYDYILLLLQLKLLTGNLTQDTLVSISYLFDVD